MPVFAPLCRAQESRCTHIDEALTLFNSRSLFTAVMIKMVLAVTTTRTRCTSSTKINGESPAPIFFLY